MNEVTLLALLRYDLNRLGAMPDDDYLKTLLRAAKQDLESTGIQFPAEDTAEDVERYQILVIGTASWMYTKRRTGEEAPAYIRRMTNKMLLEQKSKVVDTNA